MANYSFAHRLAQLAREEYEFPFLQTEGHVERPLLLASKSM